MSTVATTSALSALIALDQWVCWRRELRNGKPTKVPYNARTGDKASVDDSSTWSTHAEAVAAAGRYDGIGFVMTAKDDIAGVDLDKCRKPETGEIEAWAQNIITRINSYAEVSPSNTGIRIFLRGVLPPGRRRKGHFETYDRDRYLTVTGHHVDGTPATLEERTAELAALHAEMFPHTETLPAEEREPQPVDLVDAELLERMARAKNGATFLRLWDGVIEDGRHSESDLALCAMLAFWTGRDVARMDRLFRGSRLYRPKWDERRGETTYGAMTINKAIEGCADVYEPRDAFPLVTVDPAVLNGTDHHQGTPDVFRVVTSERSFVTRYVRYARQRTDAPDEAHELMAVAILSALAGPEIRLPIATSPKGWRLVLWVLYIVNSTLGRKTTVEEIAKDVIEAVLGDVAIVEWEGSPQGLIQKLQERDGLATILMRDEYSGLMAQMNRGGHMAGLPQTLIRAFDGGVLENIRTRKKDKDLGMSRRDVDRAERPYLVTIAAATWDAFIERATIDNVLDGFLARFIVGSGTATPRAITKTSDTMMAERNAVVKHAMDFHRRATESGVTTVDVSDSVLEEYWTLEQRWGAVADRSPSRDAAAPSMKRLAESVLRVAALLAIDEDDWAAPRVEMEHFEAAAAMGARWQVSTLRLIEALGASKFQRDAEAIIDSVKRHPKGMKLSELYRAHQKLRKRDFDELLEALELREEIVRVYAKVEGRGRPPVVVYPYGHAPEAGA